MFTNTISTGLLHNHTEESLLDGYTKPDDLVKRAAELGAKAVALTDHGTMTAVPKFKKACKEANITPIVGVETYVAEEGEKRTHLILMATDAQGEKMINKLVTLSNSNVSKSGKLRFPTATNEMLAKCFGKGSAGYGHVIATSACINGVVLGLHFRNESNKEILQNLKKQNKGYFDVQAAISYAEKLTAEAKEKISKLTPYVKKTFKQRENFVAKIQNEEEKRVAEEQLNKEKQMSAQAEMMIKSLKAENTARQKKITELKKKLPKENFSLESFSKNIESLENKILSKDQLIEAMKREAKKYDDLFGHGNFFLEVQNHNMPEELEYMHILVKIAEELDIPYVAANDSHFARKEDAKAREAIRSLRFNKWEPMSEYDKELYIKTDAELFKILAKAIGEQHAATAIQNIGLVVARCNGVMKNSHHYPKFSKNGNSDELLRKLAYEGIPKRFTKEQWTKEYQDRLEYELSVIIKMGYSDYHLIDQDFINFTKKLGYMSEDRYKYLEENMHSMSYEEIVAYVEADQSNIGYVIGPGRGSAAGSLVCYLLGITDIDPIKHGLLFERFLNVERVSMPDIDTDFANGYREVAVEYVAKKYGENAVCRIVTKGTAAARGAIRNVARCLGQIEGHDEDLYNMIADKLARKIPVKPHETISAHLDEMQDIISENPIEANEILEKAMSIEGSVIQYGMHAAGVIISDNDDVSDYVPLMLDDKSGKWKCQCDMVESEEAGLLKMDFLGLRNLNIITETIRMIWKNKGVKINPDVDIKEDKKVIKGVCAAGKTNSVFQFESGGMKQMLQQFAPDSFEDLITLVAAYRPGPMDYIPQMIEVKHGRRPLEFATPELEPILKVTYGCIIYQEQVQQIFQRLAGYSLAQADIVRRAMSKKKEKVLLAERESFINGDAERNIVGCVANGISAEVANSLFDSMTEFAKYAFNKSHAAAYARVAYITAWLKYYYPAEYLCVAMEYASKNKIQGLIDECKSYGISVLPIDINKSGASFTAEDNNIYFGITSVDGIGNIDKTIEARKQRKFVSFADYMLRGHIDKGVTENLIKVGAFDKFCNNRKALLTAASTMACYLKTIKDSEKKTKELEVKKSIISMDCSDEEKRVRLTEAKIKFGKNIPDIKKVEESIEREKEKRAKAEEDIKFCVIPAEMPEDYEERLEEERQLIGVYITGHPIDAYSVPKDAVKITDLVPEKKQKVLGIIRNLRITQRKKDGAEMAFFEVEDKTDTLDVVCFASKYEYCKEFIKEGDTVIISGKIVTQTKENVTLDENGEETVETEEVYQMYCDAVMKAKKMKKDFILNVVDIMDWTDRIQPQLMKYASESGEYRIILRDMLFEEMRPTNIYVSADVKAMLA